MRINVTRKQISDTIRFRKDRRRLPELALLYVSGYLCPVARAMSLAFDSAIAIGTLPSGWCARALTPARIKQLSLPAEASAWIEEFEHYKRGKRRPQPISFDVPSIESWPTL